VKELNKQKNIVVLANMAELVSGIVLNIAGNDISNSINGAKINKEIISNIVYQKIVNEIGENQ